MKVSVNWLKDYLSFDLPSLDQLVQVIGAQLGAVEETTDIGAKYAGAVVVKVVECAPLQNSDHLNLCFVDDGGAVPDVNRRDDGLVQVVCGAPNVVAGVTVAWLPPGATVPSTYDHEPFVLEARELRGAASNGMLASAKELAIGDSHEGLLLLDNDVPAGTGFADAYKLNDHIIDIENKMFTHRPDCFGQLGVAREVAGILGHDFNSPQWYTTPLEVAQGNGLQLAVDNQIPSDVPRFMAIALKNITIAPSPMWLQTYLSRVGLRPINNVVDITNYMMLLTGQPLHAYDYDKVAALSSGDGALLVVRYPQPNEQLELLSGKTITPRDQAIIIATDRQAIGLGGVMGGGNTEVDADTKSIILECASFDMYSIRRSSMAHGLFTDAVTRFNKGQSPLQNPAVLAKSVELLQQLAGAQPASPINDDNQVSQNWPTVELSTDFINQRLGLQLSEATITQLLLNVEFAVEINDLQLTIRPPFWRTDIEQPEDIVEEVGRLYGFDKLALELPQRNIVPAAQDSLLAFKGSIRRSLATAGANELLTYSFVHGRLLDHVDQGRNQAFSLGNALSPDLQYYRFNPLPSLLDKVHGNIKAGYDQFALFELGKGHSLDSTADDGLPLETEYLDMVYASKTVQAGAVFYRVRRLLDALAADLGMALHYTPFNADNSQHNTAPFDPNRSASVMVGDTVLGVIGEFKPGVRRNLKLPEYCAGLSVDVQKLLANLAGQPGTGYLPLPRFPKVEQDICLKVPAKTPFTDLARLVNDFLATNKPDNTRLQISTLDIYQRSDNPEYKQITFRVALAHFEKTMTDQAMAGLLDHLAQTAAERFQAERL